MQSWVTVIDCTYNRIINGIPYGQLDLLITRYCFIETKVLNNLLSNRLYSQRPVPLLLSFPSLKAERVDQILTTHDNWFCLFAVNTISRAACTITVNSGTPEYSEFAMVVRRRNVKQSHSRHVTS